jgi:hypothetical protein
MSTHPIDADPPPHAGSDGDETGPYEAAPADEGSEWEDGGAGEPVVPEVARVAAAVTAMDVVVELPVGEHVARYEALHGELSDALAAIDGV